MPSRSWSWPVRAGPPPKVAWAISDDELDAALTNPGLHPAMLLPMATVVRPEIVEIMRRHTFRMAPHGVHRRVFTEREPALRWVMERASLFQDALRQ